MYKKFYSIGLNVFYFIEITTQAYIHTILIRIWTKAYCLFSSSHFLSIFFKKKVEYFLFCLPIVKNGRKLCWNLDKKAILSLPTTENDATNYSFIIIKALTALMGLFSLRIGWENGPESELKTVSMNLNSLYFKKRVQTLIRLRSALFANVQVQVF